MTTFLRICHVLPHEGHEPGPGDPPLHPDGRRHVELANRWQRGGVDRVVGSPQQRALDTARPLARRLGREPRVYDGLAGVDHGTDRYRSVEALRSEEPHRFGEFAASPARCFGKDPEAYRCGALQACKQVLADGLSSCVAVVSSGRTIKTILCAVLGIDACVARFLIGFCSVTPLSGPDLARLRVDSVNQSLCRPSAAARLANKEAVHASA